MWGHLKDSFNIHTLFMGLTAFYMNLKGVSFGWIVGFMITSSVIVNIFRLKS